MDSKVWNEYEAIREEENKDLMIKDSEEINWDCPCLKSALEPPCGVSFREAFECFVKSKVSPKGSDCIKYFQVLQECYRSHPDIYNVNDDEKDTVSKLDNK